MKITREKLREIIKEEFKKMMETKDPFDKSRYKSGERRLDWDEHDNEKDDEYEDYLHDEPEDKKDE